ncbi:MAG TPA: glycoside hydrolase family 15 protein [Streptosporangiaceae bacterium]|nr:glycoside hydrolase family 15 protein [Streptosporangiaceae bacterium]
MPRPIDEYALIGDLHSAGLVCRNGSIDWLCLPRFDSQACFAALVGDTRHGYWQIAPEAGTARTERAYLPDTLVLQTEFTTPSGSARLVDCMPPRGLADTGGDPMVLRTVEGISGTVRLRMTLAAGFEYGSAQPQIHRLGDASAVVAGSEALWLFSPVHLRRRQGVGVAEFSVSQGDQVPFALIWRPAHAGPPVPPVVSALTARTAGWWREWVAGLRYEGDWYAAVIRSLITLKALTYAPTGGVISAPTTSLPQQAAGSRNWDYRYCWIRDSAAALDALIRAGAPADATAVLNWMIRAVSGSPAQVQALYGVAGEQRLPELELDWLTGYEGARPVRIGNAAAGQFQLTVFGEVLRARLTARMAGMPAVLDPWEPDAVLGFLESRWREPDAGIWQVRGVPRQFVDSKAMVWAAADAAVKMIEHFGDPGPAARWRRLRDASRREVLERGYDAGRHTFVQRYSAPDLDASLLRLPLTGFLPATDERITATVDAIVGELSDGGLLRRHVADLFGGVDGVPSGEGAYLPCSFWLAECLARMGRPAQARELMCRLLELRNDVGLLAEQYDPLTGRLAGNFPLAGCHAALVVTAAALSSAAEPPPGYAVAANLPGTTHTG